MIWRIKWENILTIMLFIAMILCWITFITIPNVYTLAIAVLETIATLVIIIAHDFIKEFREQMYK